MAEINEEAIIGWLGKEGPMSMAEITEKFVAKQECRTCDNVINKEEWEKAYAEVKTHVLSLTSDGTIMANTEWEYELVRQ